MSTIRLLARLGRNAVYQGRQQHGLICGRHMLRPLAVSTHLSSPNQPSEVCKSQREISLSHAPCRAGKSHTKASPILTDAEIFGDASKLGLFARFKLMYKKYWYVLIPVHVVTSIGWLGGFYYLSKSGVDVPALLHYMHVSDAIIDKMQGSSMGHWAIAYLCYKVATPVRYAVTLGGTTVSIKYLVQAGHIKPMPSKQEFMNMYEQKKAGRAAAKAEQIARGEKGADVKQVINKKQDDKK